MSEPLIDRKRRSIKIAAISAALVAVVGGALAFAHSGGRAHGPGMDRSPERHLEHMQALLTRAGASDAQKAQIEAILKPALSDMQATHETHFAALKQFHRAILAPSIDRAGLESLRSAQVKSLDDASKRLVTAFGDAAEVLSPQQRAAFDREITNHHGG
jgi:Spy/CpxP family protein refolding chaperone